MVELKGLKALGNLEDLLDDTKSTLKAKEGLRNLAIDLLSPGIYQPRKDFSDEALSELAESIKSQGIIQPLIVREVNDGQFEIIAGERRWRASKLAGLKEVPVVVRHIDDNTALAFALIENIQRESLNLIEEAEALARLRDEFHMSHEEIAKTVGRSRTTVTNILRLLTLEEFAKNCLKNSLIEMGHARAILTLTHDEQKLAAQKIVNLKLTVRQTERLVHDMRASDLLNKADGELTSKYRTDHHWSDVLTKKLNKKVKVKLNSNGVGKVTVDIDSVKDLEWLIEHFLDK